jgi:hypothetical protein
MISSGYTCGHINSKTLCLSSVPSCQPTYIRVSATAGFSPLAGGGDSGGPWFLGNTAYGTAQSIPGDNHNDAIYMAVNYVAGMNVSVMTQP